MVQAHERLIHPIMQSVLSYLGEDPALFDDRLTATNFGFRLNYYPAMTDVPEGTTGRMLGHEDVDLFTILPAAETEGLQLLHRKTMKWVRVAAPPGAIVLNTGDYMQRITNNRLPSTTHRVSAPRDPAARARPRTSFPMAIYVWEGELLRSSPEPGRLRSTPRSVPRTSTPASRASTTATATTRPARKAPSPAASDQQGTPGGRERRS